MQENSVRIAIVVAAAENGVIGRDGALPWRMPSDLKAFRRLTLGKPVVMGRRTFHSIGRPLDGRDNIVVTRGSEVASDPARRLHVVPGIHEALELARALAGAAGSDEAMVIGGAEIYRQALPRADRIYLTRIGAIVDGDATFPEPDAAVWREAYRVQLAITEHDQFPATLIVFDRHGREDPPGA